MPKRPDNIPAHAQEFYFTAPPLPLIGNEAWERSYLAAERTHQRPASRPASKASAEKCGTKRAGLESDYRLSDYDRDRWLKPPQEVGDGSVVKYDAILTRAGIYEFEADDGSPIYVLKPPKILEAADWSGVPVLRGPDHPKRDDDPNSPYAFDIDDTESRAVGAVLHSYFLDKDWALYDSEESLAYGRLSVFNREARAFIEATPYVSTGYRSFIIERSGVWGDGDDPDDRYTHEFVWIDPLHLTLTTSPRSGSVTQIRTEARANGKGRAESRAKRTGNPADALAWREARLIQGARGESASLSDVALRRFYAMAQPIAPASSTPAPPRPVATRTTPTAAPARAESRNPMNDKTVKIHVEGVEVELPQIEGYRINDALKAKDKALAEAQGSAAAAQKLAADADKVRAQAESDVQAAKDEAAKIKAKVEALEADNARLKAEADNARAEGTSRLRLLRALGSEAKPADEALPIHDLRLRVVDGLGFKESLPANKRADAGFVEAFVEGALLTRTPAAKPQGESAPAQPAAPAAPGAQARSNAEALASAATQAPADASATFHW